MAFTMAALFVCQMGGCRLTYAWNGKSEGMDIRLDTSILRTYLRPCSRFHMTFFNLNSDEFITINPIILL